MDRLSPDTQMVLKVGENWNPVSVMSNIVLASVIGNEFDFETLQSVYPIQPEKSNLKKTLQEL